MFDRENTVLFSCEMFDSKPRVRCLWMESSLHLSRNGESQVRHGWAPNAFSVGRREVSRRPLFRDFTNYATRIASSKYPIGDLSRDYATRTDHSARPNAHAWQDDRATTHPHV